MKEAEVACRQLGYPAAERYFCSPRLDEEVYVPALTFIGCEGNETNLLDCTIIPSFFCMSPIHCDAAVNCLRKLFIFCMYIANFFFSGRHCYT